MVDDPKCGICGEPRSKHVPTESGPFTHPRQATGEGHYELVAPGFTMGGAMGSFPGDDDIEVGPVYRFVPREPM